MIELTQLELSNIDSNVCSKCITSRTCKMRYQYVPREGVRLLVSDCSIVQRYYEVFVGPQRLTPCTTSLPKGDAIIVQGEVQWPPHLQKILDDADTKVHDNLVHQATLHTPEAMEALYKDPRPDLSATCGQATECPCPGCCKEDECNEPSRKDSAEVNHDDPINQR